MDCMWEEMIVLRAQGVAEWAAPSSLRHPAQVLALR